VGDLETFRQFDNRHLRYVAGGFIAEDFRQKENVLKDSSSHSFLSSVSHNLSFPKAKALRRITEERLCSTKATSPSPN
jgi:hypothetical protein